jgi:NDP-sugar pyrophosphorylase family protein
MKAIIFAAGLGSRLKEITKDKPKALVEVNGKTLIAYAIEKLDYYGFDEIIINVHHHYQQIIDFVRKHYASQKIHFSIEKEYPLETGGGLLKAKNFFDENPFLAYNTDILSDIDLAAFYQQHQTEDISSLACMQRESNRRFLTDANDYLCGWENISSGERIISRKVDNMKTAAFCGIHIINPKIFDLLEQNQAVFSITKSYIELCEKHKIKAIDFSNNKWIDVGKAENISKAASIFR